MAASVAKDHDYGRMADHAMLEASLTFSDRHPIVHFQHHLPRCSPQKFQWEHSFLSCLLSSGSWILSTCCLCCTSQNIPSQTRCSAGFPWERSRSSSGQNSHSVWIQWFSGLQTQKDLIPVTLGKVSVEKDGS